MSSYRRSAPRRAGLLRIALAGVLTAAAILVSGVPAQAAVKEPGSLTLYSRPDFTGVVQHFEYFGCTPPANLRVAPPVASFDNQPPVGCQVHLVGFTSAGYTLCGGRGVVPVQARNPWLVRIQPGLTRPCFVSEAESATVGG
jgi:hypothetical protein